MNWVISVFFGVSVFFQSTTGIRASFEQADKSAVNAEAFYAQSLKLAESTTANAYIGASLITKGKFAKGLKNKKQDIEQGAQMLDKAVATSPTNLEIRLIRLIIQVNLPKVVNYKANIEEDKAAIITNFASQPADIKKWIASYANQSTIFTAAEKSKLHIECYIT